MLPIPLPPFYLRVVPTNDTMNADQRKAALEARLSRICGFAIEITIRGLNAFTISSEGNTVSAMDKAKSFLGMTGALSGWQADYDQECDQTCAYFNLNA